MMCVQTCWVSGTAQSVPLSLLRPSQLPVIRMSSFTSYSPLRHERDYPVAVHSFVLDIGCIHCDGKTTDPLTCCAVLLVDMLGVRRGTIRATVLIETITAAFEMDEIIYELRQHSAGLNCGRWDYIFSFIKKFRNHPDKVLPNR